MSASALEPVDIDEADLEQIAGVDEDEESLEVLGIEKPEAQRHVTRYTSHPNAKWKTFRSPAEILEYAAEVGADMAMGVYTDSQGRIWKPRTPIIAEIMRHLGYGVAYTGGSSRRPVWWPERGSQAFHEYVNLKVQLRRRSGGLTLKAIEPYMESLIGLSVVELTRRLTISPADVSTRDLSDIVSRTTNTLQRGDKSPVNDNGIPKSVEGKTIFLTIIEQAKNALPEGIAREQLMKLFSESIEQVKEAVALPAFIDSPARVSASPRTAAASIAAGTENLRRVREKRQHVGA